MLKKFVFLAFFTLGVAVFTFAEDEYDDLFTFRTVDDFKAVAEKWAEAYMKKVPKLKVEAEVIDQDEFKDKIDNEMFTIGPMLPQDVVDRLESSVSPTVHIDVFTSGSKTIYAWGDEIMIGQNKLLRDALEILLSSVGQTIAKNSGYTPLPLKKINEERKQWNLKELTKDQYKF